MTAMGSRYVWYKFGKLSFLRTIMRNRYLVGLAILGLIVMTAFGGFFYLMTQRSSSGPMQNTDGNHRAVRSTLQAEESPAKPSDDAADLSANSSRSVQKDEKTAVTMKVDADNAQLLVNGQSIHVPKNGTVHKVIRENDSSGNTHVDISATSRSNNRSDTSSSLELNVESSSTTERGGR